MTDLAKLTKATPNVLRSLADVIDMTRAAPTCEPAEAARYHAEAVTINDLMNYSYEVADTKHVAWLALDVALTDLFRALSARSP